MPSPAGREAGSGVVVPPYVRHRPERTLLYELVEEYFPAFKAHLAAQGSSLPKHVEQEFEEFLKCGRLEHGFLRVCCDNCSAEHLVAFSCKRRGYCRGRLRPSCSARRMAESAALLVDDVFPRQPVRQWVLSVPYPLRFLFASRPEIMSHVLGIVYRCIATHLCKKAGFSRKVAQTGAVTLIQRFGWSGTPGALNLNPIAALVPKPRVNQTRFHGVFAGTPDRPNSKHRAVITKAKRGKRKQADVVDEPTSTERRASMTAPKGHKGAAPQVRVQHRSEGGPIETCTQCGGTVKVIVGMPNHCIEDPIVIRKIRCADPA